MSATDRPRCPAALAHIAVLVLAACPALALGQAVTDADIARVQRETPTVTEADIERARRRHALPADLEGAPVHAPRSPNLDALPTPSAPDALDLAAVAEGFQRTAPTPSLGADHGPALLVFISLSMPEPALRRLIAQAAQARAAVLIRGFTDGSLRQTAARLQGLIGQQAGSVQIDPRLFDQYGIARVPAFVLTTGSEAAGCVEATCRGDSRFVRVHGDVSLDYALAHVQRTAPAWASAAAAYLQRLDR